MFFCQNTKFSLLLFMSQRALSPPVELPEQPQSGVFVSFQIFRAQSSFSFHFLCWRLSARTANFVFCRSTEPLMVDKAAPVRRSRVTNKDLRTVLSANTFICVCREVPRKLKSQSFAVISPRFLAPPLPPVSHRWCRIRRSHVTVAATCDSSSASSPSLFYCCKLMGRQVFIYRSLWKHSSK